MADLDARLVALDSSMGETGQNWELRIGQLEQGVSGVRGEVQDIGQQFSESTRLQESLTAKLDIMGANLQWGLAEFKGQADQWAKMGKELQDGLHEVEGKLGTLGSAHREKRCCRCRRLRGKSCNWAAT